MVSRQQPWTGAVTLTQLKPETGNRKPETGNRKIGIDRAEPHSNRAAASPETPTVGASEGQDMGVGQQWVPKRPKMEPWVMEHWTKICGPWSNFDP